MAFPMCPGVLTIYLNTVWQWVDSYSHLQLNAHFKKGVAGLQLSHFPPVIYSGLDFPPLN